MVSTNQYHFSCRKKSYPFVHFVYDIFFTPGIKNDDREILYGMKKNVFSSIVQTCIFLFFIASFTGFLWEVIIYLVLEGTFYKRGFFYGPWLPVYGTGTIFIYLALNKKRDKPAICFIYSAAIGTVIELFTGWLLDSFFHLRYWNYEGQFLNYKGYICLYSIVGFGICGAIMICKGIPLLLKLWNQIPIKVQKYVLTILLVLFTIDCAASLIFPNTGRGITF